MKNMIRQAFGAGSPRDPTTPDAELLAAYNRDNDQGAFAALVDRHGPLVYSVCRRVLSDPHDADDAFQAVFLVFLRRAGSLRGGQLAGWFYGVALRTAKAARKTTARRQRLDAKYRETDPRVADEPADPAEAADLRAVLDRELGRLSASARAAILLCDVEGRTRKEAAAELGCPEGTIATRLTRAREMLARRLARLGITLAVPVLIAFLATESRAAVPVRVKAAVLLLPSGGEAAPAAVMLSQVVLAGLATNWVWKAVVGAAIAGALATGAIVVVRFSGGGEGPGPGVTARPSGAPFVRWAPGQAPGYALIAGTDAKVTAVRVTTGVEGEKPGHVPTDPKVAISPDGKHSVTIGPWEDKTEGKVIPGQLILRDREKRPDAVTWLRPPPLPQGYPKSLEPSWSPDGKRIVCLIDPTSPCMPDGFKGLVVSVRPFEPRLEFDIHGDTASTELLAKPRFHPDGRVAVLHRSGGDDNRPLYDLILHRDKGPREVVMTRTPVLEYAFSPDGSTVAVSVVGRGLLLRELSTKKETWVPLPIPDVDPMHDFGELLWQPDGKVIAFRTAFVRGTQFSGKGLKITGSPVPVVNQDRVGFIELGDPPTVRTHKVGVVRLSHWQPDSRPFPK